jgi:hypothetical protein
VSDSAFDQPYELEPAPAAPNRAGDLLRRPDFRRVYLAVAASELGDALHYIALMWFAFDVGGAGGVIAVRVADSVPALLFGLHGSATADRFSRKRLMVGADLVLGAATSYFTELRAGIAALRPRPLLAAGVLALGVAVTITSGSWIAGIPTLVRDTLHHGAGGFSLLMVGYAAGAIAGGIVLARRPIRRKARASLLARTMYLPATGYWRSPARFLSRSQAAACSASSR